LALRPSHDVQVEVCLKSGSDAWVPASPGLPARPSDPSLKAFAVLGQPISPDKTRDRHADTITGLTFFSSCKGANRDGASLLSSNSNNRSNRSCAVTGASQKSHNHILFWQHGHDARYVRRPCRADWASTASDWGHGKALPRGRRKFFGTRPDGVAGSGSLTGIGYRSRYSQRHHASGCQIGAGLMGRAMADIGDLVRVAVAIAPELC